jgi:uncharacterized protein DUF6596
VPPVHLLGERLGAVLAVVYLIFNEGYGGRDELAAEAIWLGRALAELLPVEPEVHGLLAMMLLHGSRREARFSDGELVLLADQDRSRWSTAQIAAGRAELDRALALRGRGPYVLQAAIASSHAETAYDWAQIAALYGELARLTGSPVVQLNRAIAIAETEGPQAGLRIIDGLGLGRVDRVGLGPDQCGGESDRGAVQPSGGVGSALHLGEQLSQVPVTAIGCTACRSSSTSRTARYLNAAAGVQRSAGRGLDLLGHGRLAGLVRVERRGGGRRHQAFHPLLAR